MDIKLIRRVLFEIAILLFLTVLFISTHVHAQGVPDTVASFDYRQPSLMRLFIDGHPLIYGGLALACVVAVAAVLMYMARQGAAKGPTGE